MMTNSGMYVEFVNKHAVKVYRTESGLGEYYPLTPFAETSIGMMELTDNPSIEYSPEIEQRIVAAKIIKLLTEEWWEGVPSDAMYVDTTCFDIFFKITDGSVWSYFSGPNQWLLSYAYKLEDLEDLEVPDSRIQLINVGERKIYAIGHPKTKAEDKNLFHKITQMELYNRTKKALFGAQHSNPRFRFIPNPEMRTILEKPSGWQPDTLDPNVNMKDVWKAMGF